MEQEPLKPKGWHSRRHETNQAHMEARSQYGTRQERKRRRQISALARRTDDLTRYLLGVFGDNLSLTLGARGDKIECVEAEIATLKERVAS